jgi:DNA segregation ATPase FtsK/SpoIIIE, S-DNA-T family
MPEIKYPFWHPKRHPDLFGVVLAAFAFSQCAALMTFHAQFPHKNILGLFGHFTAYGWLFVFGAASGIGIISIAGLSWALLSHNTEYCSRRHLLAAFGGLFSLSMLATLIAVLFPQVESAWANFLGIAPSQAWLFRIGGMPASVIYHHLPYINFERLFSIVGTALLASTSLFVCLLVLFDVDLRSLWQKTEQKEKKAPISLDQEDAIEEESKPLRHLDAPERSVRFGQEPEPIQEAPEPKRQKDGEPFWPLAAKSGIPVRKVEKTPPPPQDFSGYHLPSIDLLNVSKKVEVSELKKELKDKADLLESTLMNFGIEAKVGQIHCGPTITLFEVHPAVGVKVGKIKTLEHDIALNMEAKSIRIIAPIPGKAAVGIEIPNQTPQEVSFREVFASYQQRGSPFKIPMLLGKSVNGELVLADLTKMPHCIIAGATGSGKSVCINSIIMSILMLARPDEIRFLMVDPKKVELAPYTELPHMIAPVITEPHTAAAALNWLVKEMEKRYEILRLTGQRNIDGFNKRKPDIEAESQAHVAIPQTLPYIVGIIDELADLMMVANQDVEAPIARIAQMARAVGIHLILATQRPSREVITGLIKANFPARISFKVASRVNSQIVLDDIGAETLLGNGDMLILLPGSSQPIRAQGVFVRDEEINLVINAIDSQLPPNYLIGSLEKLENESSSASEDIELDDLFEEAKTTVLTTGNASTTFLQRKLKIGYARAASIMDQLELQGIVGPQEGAKPRRINFPKNEEVSASNDFDDSDIG